MSLFLTLITTVFVVAKLWGQITWSWWFVFLPIWGPAAAALVITGVALGAGAMAAYLEGKFKRPLRERRTFSLK